MTLDALLLSTPNAPPSRSMIGAPRRPQGASGLAAASLGSVSSCSADGSRIARYADMAAAGLETQADGDLALFDAEGRPTANLARMLINMSRVEIGPHGATPDLIDEGITQAFRAGRNPGRS